MLVARCTHRNISGTRDRCSIFHFLTLLVLVINVKNIFAVQNRLSKNVKFHFGKRMFIYLLYIRCTRTCCLSEDLMYNQSNLLFSLNQLYVNLLLENSPLIWSSSHIVFVLFQRLRELVAQAQTFCLIILSHLGPPSEHTWFYRLSADNFSDHLVPSSFFIIRNVCDLVT
jgi:hypothetical protein